MKKTVLLWAMPIMALLSLVSCEDKDDAITNDANSIVDASDDENEWQNCQQVNLSVGNTNGYEYVDLGLPSGILWAKMNVGADSITDFGDYFAWGETEPKMDFSNHNYKFITFGTIEDSIEVGYYTKYVHKSIAEYTGYKGYYDNKTVLDLEDDAAAVKMGGSWRMPTHCEMEELLENCEKQYVSYQGVNGYKLTGPNGAWIFLPASGFYYSDYVMGPNEQARYWCSSYFKSTLGLYEDNFWGPTFFAKSIYLAFKSEQIQCWAYCRFHGYTIRAVCPTTK